MKTSRNNPISDNDSTRPLPYHASSPSFNLFNSFNPFNFLLLLFASLALVAQSASAATLTTDKPDYPPGATVTITGNGFGSNDTVTLQVLHVLDIFDNDTSTAHQPWTVTADADGNFVATWVVPIGEDEAGATLEATATGDPSELSASVTFTDTEDNRTSSIGSNFNGTPIAGGRTIWFNAVFNPPNG